jgi:hypothetical protein
MLSLAAERRCLGAIVFPTLIIPFLASEKRIQSLGYLASPSPLRTMARSASERVHPASLA